MGPAQSGAHLRRTGRRTGVRAKAPILACVSIRARSQTQEPTGCRNIPTALRRRQGYRGRMHSVGGRGRAHRVRGVGRAGHQAGLGAAWAVPHQAGGGDGVGCDRLHQGRVRRSKGRRAQAAGGGAPRGAPRPQTGRPPYKPTLWIPRQQSGTSCAPRLSQEGTRRHARTPACQYIEEHTEITEVSVTLGVLGSQQG